MDIPSIITKKLLKAAMKHIEVIVKASQKGNTKFYVSYTATKFEFVFIYQFHFKYLSLSTDKLSDIFTDAVKVLV